MDFNNVDATSYLDGTQFDARGGDDIVILPDTANDAMEAGFTPGTLFLAGGGEDQVTGGNLADLVDGGNGDDLLVGSEGDDSLFGGNSNDLLDGGTGGDLLDGGNGQDVLLGNAGADTLVGGTQNDTLIGEAGDDVMTGGGGRDTFAFSLASDQGSDVILDFTIGNGGDRLQLSDVVDESGDGTVDLSDLDAGGHDVQGSAGSVVITFSSGTNITMAGLDGTGVDSFADLAASTVAIDIV